MSQRLARVRRQLEEHGYQALISTDPANIRYLTGFKGEPRTLLVTPDQFLLLTARRSLPWAIRQTATISDLLELSTAEEVPTEIARRLPNSPVTIALDASVSHASVLAWREELEPHRLKPGPVTETIRQIKSPAEVALLQESQRLNEAILAAVLPKIRPHMTERAVQGLFLAEMARRETVEGFAFTPIVAAGPTAWEIHHLPDTSVVGKDQMIILDHGVVYQGYASDMTRTVCLGKSTPEMREVHALVTEALEAAIASATVGKSNHEVDRVAREIIAQAGWGEFFTHGLGHQIGLQTHDPAPALSQKAREVSLEAGMTFTIEPGIYRQDKFGVRTEDVIVITDGPPKNLTRPAHRLLELDA